jgi:serine/threonine protein kinase
MVTRPSNTSSASTSTKSPVGVIETNDVKRNTVQVPATLTHATPTAGDWVKHRCIVNNYILLNTLGTGSYGQVRLCKNRESDKLFAIKIISRDMLKRRKNGNTTETYLADIQREIAIMKKLDHPNVLKLFEVLDDPNVNKLYLVLEYMKTGDLINYIKSKSETPAAHAQGKDTFTPLSDRQLWNIFRQVVSGVIYLHFQNIVHGDIKPQNLLVDDGEIVKIADFGISKMLDGGEKVEDAAGTPAFMSPELCAGQAFDGQLADVWAIGGTMYMLKFGNPPFLASNVMSLYYKIQNDPLVFPFVINPNLKDLLEKMLTKDPSERYTLPQVSSHIWLLQVPITHYFYLIDASTHPHSML